MSVLARHELELRKTTERWWRKLRGLEPNSGKELDGGEPWRGDLARLRRIDAAGGAGSPHIELVSALEVEPFLKLWRDVAEVLGCALDHPRIEFTAVAAATLARVRTEQKDPRGTAGLLGDGEPQKRFAESRFRRLIRTDKAADLLDQGRRIAAILGGSAPVGELGASLILWNEAPEIKRRWAFAYYGRTDASAGPASPSPIQPADNTGVSV